MAEQGSFKEMLRRNRKIFLGILLLPVVGMVVAISLIIIRAPRNLGLSLGLVSAMIVQYIVVVFLIMRRLNRLAES